MKINTHHHRIMAYVLLIPLIFWTGRLSLQYQIHSKLPAVMQVNELNIAVPVFSITSIRDAVVHGEVNQTDVRITSGDQVAVPDEKGGFSIDISHLGYIGPKRTIIKHQVPEWAQFVASKNGKYFYAIDEKQAKRLSVPNRLYFQTEEEAREVGYLKRGA